MIPGDYREQLGKLKSKMSNSAVPDFYDEDGNLNPELVTDYAKEVAESIRGSSKTQVRKFYNEVLGFYLRVKSAEESPERVRNVFKKIEAEFRMLKAKADYYHSRKAERGSQITGELKEFIHNMVDKVKDANDLKAFKTCFESVVGYFRGGE